MRRPTKVSITLSIIILYAFGGFLLYAKLLDHDEIEDWLSFNELVYRPQNDTTVITQRQRPTGRFPKYGAQDFLKECSFAAYHGNTGNCAIHVQPPQFGTEGIGNWIPQIVSGHLLSIQAGCNLRFDYSKSVDIAKVLMIPSNFTKQDWNWTMPVNYDCKSDPRCYLITDFTVMSDLIPHFGGNELATTPYYRFTYNQNFSKHNLSPFNATALEAAIPGYHLLTGFACSLGWLFHLSPTSSDYEPDLFDSILPMLNQEETLVIAIYLRTGETDVVAKQEEEANINATTIHNSLKGYRAQAQHILKCTIHQEEQYLMKNLYFTKVVWLVVTDSHDLKQWIVNTYNNTATNAPKSSPRQQIHRQVVTTQAHGVHTRSRRGPKTSDFAEAMIDWYLIGESDFVVLDNVGQSFGGTAALRTNRPVYHASSGEACVKTTPKFVYFDENKAHLRQCKHLQSIKRNLSPMCVYLLNANGALKGS